MSFILEFKEEQRDAAKPSIDRTILEFFYLLGLAEFGLYVFETRHSSTLIMVASMTEIARRPWIVSAAVLCGLGLAIFVVGAVLGYCQGAFGEGGGAEQGFDWAVKTGLLLVAMSAFLGIFGGVVLSKLRLPAFIGWAFVMGLAFAIMNGGGILLGMSDKVFWPETIKGFFFGAIVGAIAGPLMRVVTPRIRSQTKHSVEQDANPYSPPTSDTA